MKVFVKRLYISTVNSSHNFVECSEFIKDKENTI